MGCDIHVFKEKHIGGKWVTADEWATDDLSEESGDVYVDYKKRAYSGRNYDLFGLLAGVRRETDASLPARGLPWDVCDEVAKDFEGWGQDAHTPSYLYLHELRSLRAWCDSNTTLVGGMKDAEGWQQLKASIDAGKPDWNLIYPYCQWTNQRNAVTFEVSAPLSFMVGDCLDKMIAAFDGVDGDNHRIVFWFDN